VKSRDGFARFNTTVSLRAQKSVATESFAQKIKKAISLDFDGDFIPDGFIQGADEADGPGVFGGPGTIGGSDGSSKHRYAVLNDLHCFETPPPQKKEHTFIVPDSSGSRTSSSPSAEHEDKVFEPEQDETLPEEARHVSETSSSSRNLEQRENREDSSSPHATSPSHGHEPITLQAEVHPSNYLTSSPDQSGPPHSNQSLTPPFSPKAASPPSSRASPPPSSMAEPSSSHSGADALNIVSPNPNSASSNPSRTREIKLVPLVSSHSARGNEERRVEEALDGRERAQSDSTPGEALKTAVPKMLEHCYADEGKLFMPFFLPGRVLHLQVKRSSR